MRCQSVVTARQDVVTLWHLMVITWQFVVTARRAFVGWALVCAGCGGCAAVQALQVVGAE